MNETEMDRIAAAMNALRPDWPVRSLRTLLATKLATRARRDVVLALGYVACDSSTKTPARVLEAGPWWAATTSGDDATARPPRREEACRLCGKYLSACICTSPTTRPSVKSGDYTGQAAAAREAMRQSTSTPKETP